MNSTLYETNIFLKIYYIKNKTDGQTLDTEIHNCT